MIRPEFRETALTLNDCESFGARMTVHRSLPSCWESTRIGRRGRPTAPAKMVPFFLSQVAI
jgi:hypothetical protein